VGVNKGKGTEKVEAKSKGAISHDSLPSERASKGEKQFRLDTKAVSEGGKAWLQGEGGLTRGSYVKTGKGVGENRCRPGKVTSGGRQ